MNIMSNAVEFTQEQKRLMTMALVGVLFFLVSHYAFATAGGSDLDAAFQDFWDDLISIAEGYGGRIMMILMVVAGIYFAIGNPNFIAFAACVVCILVLANVSSIIDSAMGASFDALPQISQMLSVMQM